MAAHMAGPSFEVSHDAKVASHTTSPGPSHTILYEGELPATDHHRGPLRLEVVREAAAVRRDVVAALVGGGAALDAERMLEEETELQRADPPEHGAAWGVRGAVHMVWAWQQDKGV